MSNPLDPLALPLAGRHLIEASAGTGKTWTIAALYLRQLLENGREPGQLLVVTFTEAAAAELRERIAARLHEARAALAGGEADEFLAALIARLPDRLRRMVHETRHLEVITTGSEAERKAFAETRTGALVGDVTGDLNIFGRCYAMITGNGAALCDYRRPAAGG